MDESLFKLEDYLWINAGTENRKVNLSSIKEFMFDRDTERLRKYYEVHIRLHTERVQKLAGLYNEHHIAQLLSLLEEEWGGLYASERT